MKGKSFSGRGTCGGQINVGKDKAFDLGFYVDAPSALGNGRFE